MDVEQVNVSWEAHNVARPKTSLFQQFITSSKLALITLLAKVFHC